MLIFLFAVCFPPLIILDKMIKKIKKKTKLVEITVSGGRPGEMGWWGFLSTPSCSSGLGGYFVLPCQGTGRKRLP